MQFSFIGYENIERIMELLGDQQLELSLTSDLTTIETVVVSEECTSVEQKIDRKITLSLKFISKHPFYAE